MYRFIGESIDFFGIDYVIESIAENGTPVLKSLAGGLLSDSRVLMEDANTSLVLAKKGAQEALVLVRGFRNIEEMLNANLNLKTLYNGLTLEARNNLSKLSPKTLKNVLEKLKNNSELANAINKHPEITRLWSAHKEPPFTAAEIAQAKNAFLTLAKELSDDARNLAIELADESGKKAEMIAIFGLASSFEKDIAINAFKAKTGATQVVTQVTLEVDGVAIRVDYLGYNSTTKTYHLGEAKFSTLDKNWDTEWLSAATENQAIVLPKVKAGTVTEYVVKATDAKKLELLGNIGLGNNSKIPFGNKYV